MPDVDPALVGLHREIDRGFRFWNAESFGGRLTPVVFAFFPQPSNGGDARLGHYLHGSWTVGKESTAEIVFYADLCLKAGAEEVFRTLVHEMVHHWQRLEGKPGKKVHNKEWHAKAGAAGLLTEGPKGITSSGDGFKRALGRFAPRTDEIPFRSHCGRGPKAKGKMRRWSCPLVCNGSIRSGKANIFLTCGVCGEPLEPDEES